MSRVTDELRGRLAKVKLIALDLDGTTLTDEKEIAPVDAEAIRKARSAGMRVTFLTGRMFGAAAPYANSLGLKNPIVCLNGSLIVEPHTGKILYENPMPSECAEEVMQRVGSAPVHSFIYNHDTIYHLDEDPEILRYLKWWAVNLVSVEQFEFKNLDKVFQIMFIGEPPLLEKLRLNLDGDTECHIEFYSYPSPRYQLHFLEVKSPGDTKGWGLRFLRKHMELGKEEVLSIGDYTNDLQLFAESGVKIAIRDSVKELRDAADYVTARSNNEGGVAEAIGILLNSRDEED